MVTIPDPSDTLGQPVVEQTVQRLIETAGRLVAGRSAPGSGVTAPDGTIDDTGRVELSQETMRRTGTDTTMRPTKTTRKISKTSARRTEKQPGEEQLYWSSGPGNTSRFQSIDLESSSKYGATAAREVTINNGRQFSESSTELEDLVDHQSDSFWGARQPSCIEWWN